MGHAQLAVQRLLPHGRLVQFGVLHGDRRLAGHAGQHVQIVAVEAVPLVRVSIWMTPSAWPSLLTNGTHIIERIWKSTMLSAISKRVSEPASAERIASLLVHHPLDDRAADADRFRQARRGDA